jgi:hypothetical protein
VLHEQPFDSRELGDAAPVDQGRIALGVGDDDVVRDGGQDELAVSPHARGIRPTHRASTFGKARGQLVRVRHVSVNQLEQPATFRANGRRIELTEKMTALLALLARR